MPRVVQRWTAGVFAGGFVEAETGSAREAQP